MAEAIKNITSAVQGSRGYKCVAGKGHLDDCKDPNGVCETNSICRFVDEIKRRGKLDKKIVSYLESNNIENGVNSRSGVELIFSLDYDTANGDRVNIELVSPTVIHFDIEKYKYNKILELLDETLLSHIDDKKRYNIANPYNVYSLISEIIYNQKRRYTRLRDDLARKIETILPNSAQEYVEFIMQEGEDMKLDQHLTIDNINKDDLYDTIKNYIDNIKKMLKREYKAPNRHVFPLLSSQFISDVIKHRPRHKIKQPASYLYSGGLKLGNHKRFTKRKHSIKRHSKRHSNRHSKRHSKKSKHVKRSKRHRSKRYRKR